MRKVPKIVWSILACVFCIVATAVVCLVFMDRGNTSDKYQEILKIIDNTYYRPQDTTLLPDASAKAMISALDDPSSFYMTAAEYDEYKLLMSNQYVGVGVSTEYNERYGFLSVTSVTPGSPADQAHIKIGNLIASVNDINVSQYTPDELNELFRSFEENEKEEDRYFNVHLLNTQGGKADVRLKCELIYAEPILYYMLVDNNTLQTSDIGYIHIRNFDDSAAISLKNAVAELQRMGARALIIDVRDNTSGKPPEVADALDYLLPKGDLFLLRDRSGKETTYSSGSSSVQMPMAIIVNQNTSCAAEVFAGVLQQAGVTIVGRRTAATALSQTIVELEDGSAVRISKYEYLTPDKKSMSELGGVMPDVPSYQIEDSDLDVQLEAAKDVVE